MALTDGSRGRAVKRKAQAKPAQEREFLSVEQVAALYELHRNTVYRYLKSGKLRGKKIGHHQWRIKRDDAYKWWDREMVPA